MKYPKFLPKSGTIGVPAPSSGAYDEPHCNRYKNSKRKLEEKGYNVVLSKNIYKSKKCRSASASERVKELEGMFENKEIDFIICAAGGEFLVEILPYINFEKIVKNPKFILGHSDPTGFMYVLTTKYDIATMYGNNFGDYGIENYDESILNNLKIISGNLITQNSYKLYEGKGLPAITGLEGYNLTEKVCWKILNKCNKVEIKGRIIGGCLDLISELSGTKYDGTVDFIEKYKEDGIIWYFDNCDLSAEELIRTMWKFNEMGYFKNAVGIIFGRNGNNNSLLGYTFEEALIDSIISKLNIPIIYDADISHKGPNLTIINGAIATVCCENGQGNIKFDLL